MKTIYTKHDTSDLDSNIARLVCTKEEAKEKGMFCLTSRINPLAESDALAGILASLKGIPVALVPIGRRNNYQVWRSGKQSK